MLRPTNLQKPSEAIRSASRRRANFSRRLESRVRPTGRASIAAPIPVTYRNRAQIALNLGGLIADGFIAVEAKDGQQVKNIGSDIIKLAKALGVSENAAWPRQ